MKMMVTQEFPELYEGISIESLLSIFLGINKMVTIELTERLY